MPTALDNGIWSPRKLLRAVIARLLGRKPKNGGAAANPWFEPTLGARGDGVGAGPQLYLQVASSVTSCTVTMPFAFAVICARKCS
jgi:hypothetical protein